MTNNYYIIIIISSKKDKQLFVKLMKTSKYFSVLLAWVFLFINYVIAKILPSYLNFIYSGFQGSL